MRQDAEPERSSDGDPTDRSSGVRRLVAESWRRSAARGVDPGAPGAPVVLTDDQLTEARENVLWTTALPVIQSLLTDAAVAAGHVVALGDADGRLLWVDGSRRMLRQADRMGFTAGALWSEEVAGTNAPGTALALQRPVQIQTEEHFVGAVQAWSCTAVPLRDPTTGDTIGVIDVTGQDDVISPMALAMVRATVAAVEGALAAAPPRRSARARLAVLGRDRALLTRQGRSISLSARHSELLLLLTLNPDGVSGESLAAQLSDDEVSPVTLRAELVRLRRVLGADTLLSRPYRLADVITTDAGELLAALDRGELSAVRNYRGPVLPSSDSPAIRELRGQLRARMRRAALVGNSVDTLLAFAATEDGHDDIEVLQAALRLLPATSPKRLGVTARIDRANALLGVPRPRVAPSATSLQRRTP